MSAGSVGKRDDETYSQVSDLETRWVAVELAQTRKTIQSIGRPNGGGGPSTLF